MTFLFVHGASHGAWCWERLLPHLDQTAVAVDLPGRGPQAAPIETITLGDWVDFVVAEIESLRGEKVVLVGHSLAGVVLPRVADRIPERIERLIFIACTLPPDGEIVLDALSPAAEAVAETKRDDTAASLVAEADARWMFCNDMDEEQTRFVLDRLVPETWHPMQTPSDLAGLRHGIPAHYVKLLRDQTIPPELQDQMITAIGELEVHTLDAGHDAMVSRPKALAELLESIAGSREA